MKKTHPIFMLSGDTSVYNYAPLFIDSIDVKTLCINSYLKNEVYFKDCVYYQLYITGDEKPAVGDWSINISSPYEHKELCRIDNEIELERYVNKEGNDCRKVIGTTDVAISLKNGIGIIGKPFVESYLFAYNAGIQALEVEMDYDCLQCKDWGYVDSCRNNCNQKFLEPKLNQDGLLAVLF